MDNPSSPTASSVFGVGSLDSLSQFIASFELGPPKTYEEIKRSKIDLIGTAGKAGSIRDFGGLWGVHGLYLLEGARSLGATVAEMVDVTPIPEFDVKVAELQAVQDVTVTMRQADFRDSRLFHDLAPVDVSLLYEVLLHQDNAVEVVKNVASTTSQSVCVAQPVLKDELFALPNAEVNLQFYPEELKDVLRYPGWWEKEPPTERFQTRYWMWGQTTSYMTSIFQGYGWVPASIEVFEMSPYWNYLLARYVPA